MKGIFLMNTYNIVAGTDKSTVVSEYIPEEKRETTYQSEAELENEFIRLLTTLGYEYTKINSELELIANLRKQLETLNNYTFTDNEWNRFYKERIASSNDGIVEKTKKIQVDYVQEFRCDDGQLKNIYLLDKKNIHNNKLQVINQYEEKGGNHETRYDVTVLVNGLPLVHIELKRRGKELKEAFNQIDRYQRDSFWAGSGLYEYIQIFVISNGTNTKYYSNTTRKSHIKELKNPKFDKKKHTSNSFEFTSFWADGNNKIIPDLVDFTKTFFAKQTILNILTKYCVFTSENMLLVMRPYQISACERILTRIGVANNYKKYGTIEGGGYIWHTTGSGKTLTSFKTAQLACNLPYIDKVLFVVDRKDLDYQTMKEYDRFEKGAANSNTSTAILKMQLENNNVKIIITTIQKLGIFIAKNRRHDVFNKHIVIIFDECHRSQFGDMHSQIVGAFKKYHLFGFTGTPIFAVNAASGNKKDKSGKLIQKTTSQVFGGEPDKDGNKVLPLHTYSIVDAINDGNVLPFRIDYVNTMKMKENVQDKDISAIDRERAMLAPARIKEVTKYILAHFDQKTRRDTRAYEFNKLANVQDVASDKLRNKVKEIKDRIKLTGFNSIFAVASVDMAKAYYEEFQKQMKNWKQIRVATIYSFGVNEDTEDGILSEENPEDTSNLDESSRDFLDKAIEDYNKMFGTNYDTSSEKFQNYYKDVSLRMKNREIDLLIVVNMFLTGFDATTLNTLWVDKNLKYHGLIQAFSRTNRILNSIKTYGNIVCFRDLEERTKEAIALFGDKNAGSIVLLRTFGEYYNGYYDEKGKYHKGYVELIAELNEKFPLGTSIVGEQNEKCFISIYNAILKMRNILTSFDDFEGKAIISDRDLQNYQGNYLDMHEKWKRIRTAEKENINDDVVFELELVKQVEVNIDYILILVSKYHAGNCEDKEILVDINKAISASIQLRSKKELIESFIETINTSTQVEDDWSKFVNEQKETDLTAIMNEENLRPDETRKFIDNSFRDGELRTSGTAIDKILPPMPLFGASGNNRQTKKKTIVEKLSKFFEKYLGLV